jgi:iron complex transport system ATP-binding protein
VTLTLDDVTFEAEGRLLVDRVSLTFAPGELHLLLGANGAGKSTLLKLLGRQMLPTSGCVRYGAVDASTLPLGLLARFRATLSQGSGVASPLRVREVVLLGRAPHFTGRPAPEDEAACAEVMALLDVARLCERDYLTLSGGEQQRVQLARVLAQLWTKGQGDGALPGPRVLLLDEPLAFLDVHYQRALLGTLQRLLARPGMDDLVAVGALHDLNLAARFGARLSLLHQGRLLATGAPEEVLTERNVETAFRARPELVQREGRRPLIWFE